MIEQTYYGGVLFIMPMICETVIYETKRGIKAAGKVRIMLENQTYRARAGNRLLWMNFHMLNNCAGSRFTFLSDGVHA